MKKLLLISSLSLALACPTWVSAQGHHSGHGTKRQSGHSAKRHSPLPDPAADHSAAHKDGPELAGPVRAVVLKTAKLTDGAHVEGPWVLWVARAYDHQGRNVETAYYDSAGALREKVTASYDTNGNLTEWVQLGGDGATAQKFVHRYDAAGRKTEVKHYGAGGALVVRQAYTYEAGSLRSVADYDAAGVLQKRQEYLSGDSEKAKPGATNGPVQPPVRQVFVSDTRRNRLELTTYRGGRRLGRVSHAYDQRGNLISSDYYGQDGRLINRSVYAYDAGARLTEWAQYDGGGGLARKLSYSYDVKGRRTAEVERGPGGSLRKQESYEYESDARGNWTKRTTFVWATEAGPPVAAEVSYRTITYY